MVVDAVPSPLALIFCDGEAKASDEMKTTCNLFAVDFAEECCVVDIAL